MFDPTSRPTSAHRTADDSRKFRPLSRYYTYLLTAPQSATKYIQHKSYNTWLLSDNLGSKLWNRAISVSFAIKKKFCLLMFCVLFWVYNFR